MNTMNNVIDIDIASMYGTLIFPIKETKMTIEAGKTYKLIEPAIKTIRLMCGYNTLSFILGEGEFEIISFADSRSFNGHYSLVARRLDNDVVEKLLVYGSELELFKEVCEDLTDPTDLLCKPVSIRRPFDNPICGWVTDQWIEDGIELLNVVHAGEFSVVPRSMVVRVIDNQ